MISERIRMRLSAIAVSLALVSLLIILFVKGKFVFDSGEWATSLVLASITTALVALVLALLSVQNRLSMLALAVVAIVAYLIFFTRLYGLS